MDDASSFASTEPWEVGFFRFDNRGKRVTSFELIFLLKSTEDEDHMPSESPYFGKVIGGNNVIETLSRKRLDDRDGFKVTIHFRKP